MRNLHTIINLPSLTDQQWAALGKWLQKGRQVRVRTTPVRKEVNIEFYPEREDMAYYWQELNWKRAHVPIHASTATREILARFAKENAHQITFFTGRK